MRHILFWNKWIIPPHDKHKLRWYPVKHIIRQSCSSFSPESHKPCPQVWRWCWVRRAPGTTSKYNLRWNWGQEQMSELHQCLSKVKALFCSKCFHGGGVDCGRRGGSNWYLAPTGFFFSPCFCFMQGSFYHMVVTDCLSWKEKPFEAN